MSVSGWKWSLSRPEANEIEHALVTAEQQQASTLSIGNDAYLSTRREFAFCAPSCATHGDGISRASPAGWLMSYGPNRAESFWQGGFYVDRILKGEKPADLPVMQPTRFEFFLNLKTVKALGL